MSELLLDSLEIKNFRCFEHLTIEKLGRVNLIVGKNSVGKSCLLEALQILASKADSDVLRKILISRNELFEDEGETDSNQFLDGIGNFFYRRENNIGETVFSIGSLGNKPWIEFGIVYFSIEQDETSGTRRSRILRSGEECDFFDIRTGIHITDKSRSKGSIISLSIPKQPTWQRPQKDTVAFITVPMSGLNGNLMAELWDAIALTPMEDETTGALQLLDSNIEKYSFQGINPNRHPKVKLSTSEKPIPLRSLGEGLSRALGLCLAIANTKGGWLLIDEFEIGLHHRIQLDLWRVIFKLAEALNVQVFATTHSWDCVEAFQEAAAEDEASAMLIRLQQTKDGSTINSVTYTKEEMDIVTRQGIEVR